ncbi:MAG: molybdate ABC transporter substrate-binding protein [Pseudomonadota bacterium]
MFTRLFALLALLLATWSPVLAAAPEPVTIFAAASTTNAVSDAAKLYEEQGLGKVSCVFASSSTLAKQITQAAPAQVFLSADLKWMDFLEEQRLVEPGTRINLLGNRLALIAPAANTVQAKVGPGMDLAGLLGEGRLAVGDPGHVPAGIYAKQALTKLGLWDSVAARLAPAANVRAALTLVERGETPLGIVYSTDAAISPKVRLVGLFPADSHPPIVYPLALVAGKATPAARKFSDFLQSAPVKAIFNKYGFATN